MPTILDSNLDVFTSNLSFIINMPPVHIFIRILASWYFQTLKNVNVILERKCQIRYVAS